MKFSEQSNRLPGYPLLIVLVYTFLGQGNLAAVSAIQAMLFVLATLELFVLAAMLFQRAWAAFLLSLLVGTNLTCKCSYPYKGKFKM